MEIKNLRMREETLLEERNTIVEEASAIAAQAERTDEQTSRFDEIEARVQAIDGDLENVRKAREWERTQPSPEGSTKEIITGVRPAHGKKGRYANLGEQVMDIYRAEVSRDNEAYERLKENAAHGLQEMSFKAAVPTGQSVIIDSEGGILVQQDFASEIWQIMHDEGQILQRLTPLPLSPEANGIELPGVDESSRADGSRYGGIRAYHVAEGDTITASKQKYYKVPLKFKKIAALMHATSEMLAHVPLMNTMLTDGMAREIGFLVEDDIFEGDGNNGPFGFTNAGAAIAIDKETGQAAATILHDNLKKMWARLHARSRANAVWLINQDVGPALDDLSKTIGTGGVEPNYVSYGLDGVMRIKGRPVIEVEYASTLGTVDDIVLVYLSQYYFIRSAINQAASMHFKFDTDQQSFRATVSVDGAIKWKSALTPFKGSNTQSPVITLATRA